MFSEEKAVGAGDKPSHCCNSWPRSLASWPSIGLQSSVDCELHCEQQPASSSGLHRTIIFTFDLPPP